MPAGQAVVILGVGLHLPSTCMKNMPILYHDITIGNFALFYDPMCPLKGAQHVSAGAYGQPYLLEMKMGPSSAAAGALGYAVPHSMAPRKVSESGRRKR